jgi:inner membrane protein
MLLFGHIAVPLGAVILLNGALTRSQANRRVNELKENPQPLPEAPHQNYSSGGTTSRFASLLNRVDMRLLIVGSLLPDIIDKPVGAFLFRDTFSNGRIFCHTLLFLILITLGGLYLYWRRNTLWLLVLSFGTFVHLILDRMWLEPRTLLWPLYGFSFPRTELTHWTWDMLHALLTNPAVWLPELGGAVIVGCFVWLLVRRGNFHAFIRNGRF